MASRKNGLVVSYNAKTGISVRFRKKASKYNRCIGEAMRGPKGSAKQVRDAFTAAAKSCS